MKILSKSDKNSNVIYDHSHKKNGDVARKISFSFLFIFLPNRKVKNRNTIVETIMISSEISQMSHVIIDSLTLGGEIEFHIYTCVFKTRKMFILLSTKTFELVKMHEHNSLMLSDHKLNGVW
jgi:hypothetical protein